jgi:hypothetical protein
MNSGSPSAAIGLTVAIGPVIAAHLLPQIWMLGQLGAVILGLIIGMQAASRRTTRHDRHGLAAVEQRAGNTVFLCGSSDIMSRVMNRLPRPRRRGFFILARGMPQPERV